MKTFAKRILLPLLLLSLLGGSAFAQRVATVDLAKVFDKYWKTDQATASLRNRVDEMQKSRNEMLDEWKKQKADYQKLIEDANNQAVSAQERDKRKQAAEDKLKDIKNSEDNISQFERQMSVTLGEQKARMRKNILEEIKLAINSKAKAGGYTLVIDSNAQTYAPDPTGPYSTPNILYSDGKNDITDAVIAQLNAGAPFDSTTSSPLDSSSPSTNSKAKK